MFVVGSEFPYTEQKQHEHQLLQAIKSIRGCHCLSVSSQLQCKTNTKTCSCVRQNSRVCHRLLVSLYSAEIMLKLTLYSIKSTRVCHSLRVSVYRTETNLKLVSALDKIHSCFSLTSFLYRYSQSMYSVKTNIQQLSVISDQV